MQENKSPLTVSQALKGYTGSGLTITILVLAAYECIFYAGAYASMALVIALSDGTSFMEAIANIAETPAGDCIMAFAPALINCLILLVPNDRSAPGGKLFRTFKGGFDTYKKSRIGIYVSAALAALIFSLFAMLLDITGLAKVQNSIFAETAVFVSSLAALGAGTLALIIRNDSARGFISVIVCFAVNAGVAIALNILTTLNGSILPHIVVGIIGAVISVIAAKAYLSYYKKNLWDS